MIDILQKPLITEKVTKANERGVYGFIVNRKANKIDIQKSVEKFYNVTVESVNTMRYRGKKKVRYTKIGMNKGRTSAYKKALVTLKTGNVIDFYEIT